MYLVDGQRALLGIVLRAGAHPALVLPDIRREIRHDGGGFRTQLALVAVGVGLEENVAFLRFHGELVQRMRAEPGDEQVEDPGFLERLHPVPPRRPAVEVAHHADRAGVRGPHGKVDAVFPVLRGRMRAELFVDGVMRAPAKQVNIQI